VHIIDASSPAALQQRETVQNVLASLGVCPREQRLKVLEVWNKADKVLRFARKLEHLFRTQVGAEGGGDAVRDSGVEWEGQSGRCVSEGSEGGTPSQAAMQRAVQMWLTVLQATESGPRRQRSAAAAAAASAAGHAEADWSLGGQLSGARKGGLGGVVGPAAARASDQQMHEESHEGLEGHEADSVSIEMLLDDDDECSNAAVRAGVVVSATEGWGLQDLRQHIQHRLVQTSLCASSA
jgi:hypothetical protein